MRLALAAAAALVLTASAAKAADYVSIVQETTVAAPAEAVWQKIGGYCDIGAWLKTTCTITSGTDREVGAVRLIAGRVTEVLVAKTPLSYTYADADQKIFYHGTLEVRPVDKKSSKLVYTLFFDQSTIPAEQQQANRDRRKTMFGNVLNTLKAQVEAK